MARSMIISSVAFSTQYERLSNKAKYSTVGTEEERRTPKGVPSKFVRLGKKVALSVHLVGQTVMSGQK